MLVICVAACLWHTKNTSRCNVVNRSISDGATCVFKSFWPLALGFCINTSSDFKKEPTMFWYYELQFAFYYNCLIFTLFFYNYLSETRPDFDKEFFFNTKSWVMKWIYQIPDMSKSFQNKEIFFQDSFQLLIKWSVCDTSKWKTN